MSTGNFWADLAIVVGGALATFFASRYGIKLPPLSKPEEKTEPKTPGKE